MNPYLAMLLSLVDPDISQGTLTPTARAQLSEAIREIAGIHDGYLYETLYDSRHDPHFAFTSRAWQTFNPSRDLTEADDGSDIEILYRTNFANPLVTVDRHIWCKVELDVMEFRRLDLHAASSPALTPCAAVSGPRANTNGQPATYSNGTVWYLARQSNGSTPIWKVTCEHLATYDTLIVRLKTP